MTSERLRVLGLGAGGHAKVVLEILTLTEMYDVVGLLDPRPELHGTHVHGVPVLGGDDLLERQYHDGVRSVFIGLGGADDPRPRRRLYELARSSGFGVVSAVHPAAVVSASASTGPGVTVAATAVIGPAAEVGENVIVNTGAIVEHDCSVGNHVHVATGARLASGVRVGDGAHVGAGATVIQGVTIGEGAVVGAAALVRADVDAGAVVVGVPARVLRHVEGS